MNSNDGSAGDGSEDEVVEYAKKPEEYKDFCNDRPEIEFYRDTVSGLNICFTNTANRLCIFDSAIKLNSNNHYDIGGTYIRENREIKPELWFYCSTSICPQSNYILNIFVSNRKGLSLSIGISETSKITKKKLITHQEAVSHYTTLTDTLQWKMFKPCELNETHYIKSFCFSKDDLTVLNEQTLCIPISIKVHTTCVVDSDTLLRIKSNQNPLKLFKRNVDTDITLESSSGNKFDAHKLVLGTHSTVIRDLLKNSPSNTLAVDVNDVTMELFLEYMYTGSIQNISASNWCQLIELTKMYKLANLFNKIEVTMIEQLSDTNAVDVAIISEKYEMQLVQKKAFEYMRTHQEILRSKGWQEFSDLALMKKMFYDIFKT